MISILLFSSKRLLRIVFLLFFIRFVNKHVFAKVWIVVRNLLILVSLRHHHCCCIKIQTTMFPWGHRGQRRPLILDLIHFRHQSCAHLGSRFRNRELLIWGYRPVLGGKFWMGHFEPGVVHAVIGRRTVGWVLGCHGEDKVDSLGADILPVLLRVVYLAFYVLIQNIISITPWKRRYPT